MRVDPEGDEGEELEDEYDLGGAGRAAMLTCRLCNEPLPEHGEAAFDPDTSVPAPSYLHVGCAKKERDRLAGEACADRARLDAGAPKLLRACQRAYRSTCATMGPASDLARTLADAIHAATGAYPPVPQVKGMRQ